MKRVRPVAGQPYTIVRGDTLWDIAAEVYGSGFKFRIIWDANKTNLRSKDPHWIYPGEVLWLPPDPDVEYRAEVKAEAPPEGRRDEFRHFSLEVAGVDYPATAATVVRSFDSFSDAWSASLRDNIDDPSWVAKRGVFQPYTYPGATVRLAGRSIGPSVIYGMKFEGSDASGLLTLRGFSPTADLMDSAALPPYEATDIRLLDWVKRLTEPFGFSVSASEADPEDWDLAKDIKLKRVRIGREEKIFDHLSELIRQFGFVLSNGTRTGLAIRSALGDPLIVAEFSDGTVRDPKTMLLAKIDADFNGRERHREYVANGKGAGSNFAGTFIDETVNRNRREVFSVSNIEEGDSQTAAQSRARKAIETALTFSIPIPDWYTPAGKLFEPGQSILYRSKRLFLDKGVPLMIREVEYVLDSDSSRSGTLSVIPASVYSRKGFADPWKVVL